MLKIALVHDYLKEYGGAERVLETLSDLFPDAPIYTSLYLPSSFGPHRARLEKKWQHRIHQSFFHFLPFAGKLISPLRFFSPLAFKSFDFSNYDLIITSATGAYFPNALNKGKAKLICYCHTPPRYLYGLATARDTSRLPIFIKAIFEFLAHFYRLLDFRYAQNVDRFIANSSTTASRIRKFYRKEPIVINPPVPFPDFKFSPLSSKGRIKRGDFFLAGGRFTHAKRLDIAIAACNQLKLPLKIFGRDFADIGDKLKSFAGPTVEFLGEVTDQERFNLYSHAKAFLFPSDNEDFGIMPLEAMSCGCPVIAHRSGGVTETVLENKTGIFFDDLTSSSCIEALQKFQKLKISSQNCINQAKKYSKKTFVQKIKQLLLKF